jgi:hypothetical protein
MRNILDQNVGCARFESQLGHRIYWFTLFVSLLICSTQFLGWYMEYATGVSLQILPNLLVCHLMLVFFTDSTVE